MDGYIQISLKNLISQLGEDKTKEILSKFYCPQNKDVENFLKKLSINFDRQGISATHIVFVDYKGSIGIAGYFTLALKEFCVYSGNLSKTLKKRISKFGTYDSEFKGYRIAAPLIAQLGKNYLDGINNTIKGAELLKMAFDKIAMVQQVIGGRIAYLECEDKPKLLEFYSENGFCNFGKRLLDRDETESMSGEYLIQLLKYMRIE